MERWYGAPVPERHYGDVLDAGRRGLPSADTALIRLASDTAEAGIVRATAVSLLDRYATPEVAAALESAAHDPEPLLRLAAAQASEVIAPDVRLRTLGPLLTDSLLAIRVEAARLVAEVPDHRMTVEHRAAADAAFDEFVAAQLVNAERPESHLRLGVFYTQRGQLELAERHYREAIRVGPGHAGGYVNLADLYRAQGRDVEGERILRQGLETVHQPAALHHSLGLLLVRTRRLDQAVTELARAVAMEPDVPRFAHVYAVALQSVGRTGEAVQVLEDARRRAPWDTEITAALASMREER
jgi:Flp pilus assembly protein TadD